MSGYPQDHGSHDQHGDPYYNNNNNSYNNYSDQQHTEGHHADAHHAQDVDGQYYDHGDAAAGEYGYNDGYYDES